MKNYLRILCVALMIIVLAACGNSNDSKGSNENDGIPTITLGVGFATEEPLWLLDVAPEVAKNNGVKYNLELEQFRANADRLNAYQAGQLDGGSLGQGALIMAAEQGVEIKVLGSIAKDTPDEGYNHSFLARADESFDSPKDFKGKTIGIVDFKSPTDLWARQAIKNMGLDPDEDVEYAVLPVPAMTEAIKSGKIDLGMIAQPFYAEVEDSDDFQVAFTSKDGVTFDEDFLALFFNPTFIEENEEAVEAFMEDYKASMKYYLENIEEARQLLIDNEFVLADPDVFVPMEDSNRSENLSLDVDSWSKLQELLLEEGWIENEIDLDELIDTSFIE